MVAAAAGQRQHNNSATMATNSIFPVLIVNGFLNANPVLASIARQMHLILANATNGQEDGLMSCDESDQYLSALIDCDDFAEFG